MPSNRLIFVRRHESPVWAITKHFLHTWVVPVMGGALMAFVFVAAIAVSL